MKGDRQKRIIELVNNRNIATQEELAEILKAEGFNVTQSTVSRDIRELALIKVGNDETQRYVSFNNPENSSKEKYIRICRDGIVSIKCAQNLCVIKCVSGMAMAVAAALDAIKFKEIVGSIAGDDTIFVAAANSKDAKFLAEKFNEL